MPLPQLMLLDDAPGADTVQKWPNYIDAVYSEFLATAANAGLMFQGRPVVCPYKEPWDGKHFSFWHSVTDGYYADEADRQPDLERCERIRWISWVISHAADLTMVRWWENERSTGHGRRTHVPLWLFNENYAVILNKGPNCYFLKTSYVLRPGRSEDFNREWTAWSALHP